MLPLFAAAAGAAAPAPAAPAAPGQLSLASALALALRQNAAVRVQEIVVDQKTGVAEQAAGAFDWNLFGGISTAKDARPLPFNDLVSRSTSAGYTLGAGKLFRDGVSIRPSVGVGVDAVSPNPAVGASQFNLQIVVPLLRGLGSDSTGAAEAAARGDVAVARLLYRHALAGAAFSTAASYWSSRAADDALKVQRDVELAAEKLVASTKVLVEGRVFPPAFLLQAEANLRDKRTVRIDAELQARNARFGFGRALGLGPAELAVTPAATDEFPALGPAIPAGDQAASTPLVERALAARADYLATRQSLVPLNILARQAELDLRPQIDLSVRGGYRGLGESNSVVAPLGNRITGPNGEVGVSFAWPYRNTYQRGLLRERRGQVRIVETQLAELSRTVANEVLIALELVRLRADSVRSAQETVDLARRAIAAQYEQLRAGEGTILDVISLENISAGARIRYINAHASYATAVAQLRYALGAVFAAAADDRPFALADLTAMPVP